MKERVRGKVVNECREEGRKGNEEGMERKVSGIERRGRRKVRNVDTICLSSWH